MATVGLGSILEVLRRRGGGGICSRWCGNRDLCSFCPGIDPSAPWIDPS